MKKKFEGKTALDPGRFRYPVTFLRQQTTIDPDGSQNVSLVAVLTSRAIREPVTRRFTMQGDMTLEAGIDFMNRYWYFTIRFRTDFTPEKDMLFSTTDGIYTITALPEVDSPPNYWRLLCIKTDQILTT